MSDGLSLRALTPNDWELFRSARLKALQEHPDVFLRAYEAEAEIAESVWRETLDGKGKCVVGLFDTDRLIGFAGVFPWRDDATGHTGVLGMDYIEPAYRGRGLSRLLYQRRIEWGLNQKHLTRLVISHREGNEASRRANQAFGFEYQGRETIRWPDGTEADRWTYLLDLERLREAKGLVQKKDSL
jgi:RimJ/RimL family protein N-acetyltransferase